MTARALTVGIAAALLLGGATRADACFCMETKSPCAALRDSPVVFVGVVQSIIDERVGLPAHEQAPMVGFTARFVVQEPLDGVSAREVHVVTGRDEGDCGYPFESGGRYLVYARPYVPPQIMGYEVTAGAKRPLTRGAVVLSTGRCDRTRRLSDGEDDLALLRARKASRSETRVFGSIDEYIDALTPYFFSLEHVRPMAGLEVILSGPTGTAVTSSDTYGRYRFTNVVPATYSLSVRLPPGYDVLPTDDSPATIVFTADDCGIEHDVGARVDGRVSGRVTDWTGRPVPDGVEVTIVRLVTLNGPAEQMARGSVLTEGGAYTFKGLPPGPYVIGVNFVEPDRASPYRPTYLPGVADRAAATIISLRKGERLTALDIRVLPRLDPEAK